MQWDEREDLYNLDLISHLKRKHTGEHAESNKERSEEC